MLGNESNYEILRRRFTFALLGFVIVAVTFGMIGQFIVYVDAGEISGSPALGLSILGFTLFSLAWALYAPQRTHIVLNVLFGFLVFYLAFNPSNLITIIWAMLLGPAIALFATPVIYYSSLVGMFVKLLGLRGAFPDIEFSGGDNLVLIMAVIAVGISMFLRYVNISYRRTLTSSDRIRELLQATAEIGQISSKLLDLSDLFPRTVNLIRDRLGYYHVQIFLVDDRRENANLVASTGSIGRELLLRKHHLPVGSRSVIGRVTQLGDVVIARSDEVDRNTVHARNELLPNTRAELALPLIDGDEIIGALDLQSTRADAFKPVEVQSLRVMANQITVAIRNARLFEEKDHSLKENKRLFIEAEAALRENQRLNSQLRREAWASFLDEQPDVEGVTYSGADESEQIPAWTPEMMRAVERHRTISERNADGRKVIAVPIMLRDQVLGAIEIAVGDHDVSDDDIADMIQTIAERLAVTLDNARLFEESQNATVQEQRINEIVRKYQQANTIDDLLQITLQELSTSLDAERGTIRLSKPETPQAPHNGQNGHQNGHHNGYHQNGQNGGTPS